MSEQPKHQVGTIKSIHELPQKEQIKALYENRQITQTKALIDLAYATTEEFFKCDLGIAATIKNEGKQQNFLLEKDLMFSSWLIHQYYSLFQDSPKTNSMKEAINTILAKEMFENHNHQQVFVRFAWYKERIYIDLGTDNYEVIEISKDGWNIIQNPPVKFIRTNTMRELPKPAKTSDINKLKKAINLNEEQFKLWLSFVFGCFNPKGPFPILVLQGASGAGKTLLSEITKAIVDPAFAPVRALPKKEEDLYVMAQQNWLMPFDNLSGISNYMSDALCKLSTGGGFTRRKLFTPTEETVMAATRPVIVNGIEYITKRQDLADRSIVLSLPFITLEGRKTTSEIWSVFDSVSGSIMKLLCDAASLALQNYTNVEMKENPRMADFAKWATAAEEILGFKEGEFLEVYMRNRQEVAEEAVEQDELVFAIMQAMKNKGVLEGPATQIISNMKASVPKSYAESVEWVAPNKLKSEVTRIEPILLANGIRYKYGRASSGRIHSFKKVK